MYPALQFSLNFVSCTVWLFTLYVNFFKLLQFYLGMILPKYYFYSKKILFLLTRTQ